MKFSYMTVTLLAAVLSACGGGNSGSNNGNNQSKATTASDAEVIANIKASNIDFFTVREFRYEVQLI